MLLASLVAVVSQFWRFRRARGEERQQIKWFAYATAITLLWMFVIEGLPNSNRLFETTAAALGLIVAPAIPGAAGVAIFRYRLYDIDLIINRTLVYGALTGALLCVYVASVVLLQYLVRALTGGTSELVIVASTLVIAALFSPLRRAIQASIDGLFYRRKYDAQRTLARFAIRLRDEVDLARLAEDFVGVVDRTVQPTHASLWLRGSTADPGAQAGGERREGG
jgi:hypothetical protein